MNRREELISKAAKHISNLEILMQAEKEKNPFTWDKLNPWVKRSPDGKFGSGSGKKNSSGGKEEKEAWHPPMKPPSSGGGKEEKETWHPPMKAPPEKESKSSDEEKETWHPPMKAPPADPTPLDAAVKVAHTALNSAVDALKSVPKGVSDAFHNASNSPQGQEIHEKTKSALNNIQKGIGDTYEKTVKSLQNFTPEKIGDGIKGGLDKMGEGAGHVSDGIHHAAIEAITSTAAAGILLGNSAANKASMLGGSVKSAASEANKGAKDLIDKASDIIKSSMDEISKVASNERDTISKGIDAKVQEFGDRLKPPSSSEGKEEKEAWHPPMKN